MIEKSIEANIISAVQALNLAGLDIRGVWQAANEGEVKDEEDNSPAALAVIVSPRAFGSNGIPEMTFEVALSLVIRVDMCPTGTAIETYCDPVVRLLQSWNLALPAGDDEEDEGFAVPGFNPHYIHFTGGNGPTFENEQGVWSVVFNLTIGGVVAPEASTTENQEES